jgi:hypothetical protein
MGEAKPACLVTSTVFFFFFLLFDHFSKNFTFGPDNVFLDLDSLFDATRHITEVTRFNVVTYGTKVRGRVMHQCCISVYMADTSTSGAKSEDT